MASDETWDDFEERGVTGIDEILLYLKEILDYSQTGLECEIKLVEYVAEVTGE